MTRRLQLRCGTSWVEINNFAREQVHENRGAAALLLDFHALWVNLDNGAATQVWEPTPEMLKDFLPDDDIRVEAWPHKVAYLGSAAQPFEFERGNASLEGGSARRARSVRALPFASTQSSDESPIPRIGKTPKHLQASLAEFVFR